MRRWIYAYESITGPPEQLEQRLMADLGRLLQAGSETRDPDVAVDGSFLLELPSELAGVGVAKQVRLRTGVAHRSGARLLIPVEWRAEPAGPVFPTFEGQVELEPMSATRAQLSLVGSYRVPLGLLGATVEAALLQHVAPRTAEHVVRLLARQLSLPPGTPAAPPPRRPLRVRDVMTRHPLVLDPDLPLKSAALLLFYAEVSGAPVVADDGSLVGVLSERDLLAKEAPERFGIGRSAADQRRQRQARTVGEACTRPVISTVPNARLADAALALINHDVSRLVVIDAGRLVGIITRHDVLAGLVRDDADLHAAIEEALEQLQVEGVRAEVTWGEVALTGTVELRSTRDEIVGAVEEVDGVMHVDAGGLAWQYDDLLPFVPVP